MREDKSMTGTLPVAPFQNDSGSLLLAPKRRAGKSCWNQALSSGRIKPIGLSELSCGHGGGMAVGRLELEYEDCLWMEGARR